MGCAGHPAAYTPNLDRLAERGGLFTNTYCNSPQCGPSRASRWSGLHIHRTGSWNNHQGLSKAHETYLTHLQNAGYRSQIFGRTDYLTGGHSLSARVCSWTRAAGIRLPQKAMPTAHNRLIRISDQRERVHEHDWELVDQSILWLRAHATDGPFFLNCSLHAPHPSFMSSAAWIRRIDPRRITLPPFEADLHPVMDHMSATKNCLHDFSDEDILTVRQTYFAMISEVDAMAGRLIRALDEFGLSDNTYIIFTSDHGEMNMEHRQYLKNAVYEASSRIPLIVSGPGLRRGVEITDLVSLVDFYPTVLDMADLNPPEGLDGRSLIPLLTGPLAEEAGRPVLSQYHSNFAKTGIFMLRNGPWKYVTYPGFASQLFNLEDDPEEIENLAGLKSEIVQDLDRRRRAIVDYEKVDAEAKDYDKASLVRWRGQVGDEAYREGMKKLHRVWNDEYESVIEAWLAG